MSNFRPYQSAGTDLSSGDDDDVVVVSDSGDKEVCYGRLESTKVNAHMVPFPKQTATYISKSDWPVSKLELRRTRSKNIIIRVIDPTGKDFGSVDVRTSSGLVPIMDSSNMKARVQARLNRRQKDPSDIPGKECSAYLDMTVNLYGPKKNAEAIGKFLSQKQLYLRTPFGVDAGIEVYNPHSLHLSSLPRTGLTGSAASSAGSGAGTGYSTRTVEEVRNDVMSMFDSLEKSDTLPEMKPDTRVKTELLSHQKQALYFMTKKEKARVFGNKDEDKNSLWRLKLRPNGQRIYLNVITGKEERTKPPEVLGGILADEMGLGKTLSILSLIVGSSADSQEWGKQKPPTQQTQDSYVLKRNSKSTLLVAPVSTIANWEEQMKIHLQPGTLKHLVYHGNNRCQNIDALAQYDMIITTYQIISSEFCGRSTKRGASPLFHTNFFRIVLDEAHTIREPSTKQSQAICTLQGQRRWAVTGTPVQNRLDDLGALIKFLQVKPFDDKGGFAQFILSPFKNADPEILPKLRLLVDSITLRRLKDRIDLPPRKDEIIRLEFSNEERPLYELFAKDSHAKMSVIVGRQNQKKGLAGKSYAHVLRSLLRLRLICAHGKELLGEDDLKMMEGQSQSNAIDLSDEGGEKQVMTSRQVYEMLMLLRESDMDLCAQCARKIEPKESIPEDSPENEVIGHMLPCYQIVCQDCILAFKKTVKENATVDNHFTCPFCEQYLQVSFFELTQSGIEAAEDAKIKARKSPKQAKIMGRYDGPHTKTRALIDSLLQAQVESMANLDQAPIKSVVFSGWTSHLDLIQVALDDHLIKYTRLDGTMNLVQRSAALEVFAHDPDVRVILVSIAAGGVGLNLTAGSRVFIMEPQFNPAAEAQAIDRVHRLGQKKQVVSTRYIMQDSVEEKMLELQRKKQDLANLSMNRGKLDKAEAAKRRLEDLKSLFK